jgi:hypothetical protein
MAKKTVPGPLQTSTEGSVADAFVREMEQLPARPKGSTRGRVLFAMDATASREPTWDVATSQQGEMFVAAHERGGLDVRLAF